MYFRHLDETAALATAGARSGLSRRQFLQLTTLAGSGLTLGIVLPGCGTGPGGAAGAAAGPLVMPFVRIAPDNTVDRKSTRLNSSHLVISYAVFCLKKKKET